MSPAVYVLLAVLVLFSWRALFGLAVRLALATVVLLAAWSYLQSAEPGMASAVSAVVSSITASGGPQQAAAAAVRQMVGR